MLVCGASIRMHESSVIVATTAILQAESGVSLDYDTYCISKMCSFVSGLSTMFVMR